MSKSNKSKGSKGTTSTITGETLATFATDSINARISALMTLHSADPEGKHDKTAGQWARELRSMGASFFDGCAALVESGTINADAMRECFNVSDAPVYGFEKLRGTINAMIRSNVSGSGISALHYGMLLALSDEYTMNDDVCKTIARVAVCSVTGTAPTQRSSSAWALSRLGMIDEQRIGRTGAARWADTPAALALRDAMGAPRDVQKGATL